MSTSSSYTSPYTSSYVQTCSAPDIGSSTRTCIEPAATGSVWCQRHMQLYTQPEFPPQVRKCVYPNCVTLLYVHNPISVCNLHPPHTSTSIHPQLIP